MSGAAPRGAAHRLCGPRWAAGCRMLPASAGPHLAPAPSWSRASASLCWAPCPSLLAAPEMRGLPRRSGPVCPMLRPRAGALILNSHWTLEWLGRAPRLRRGDRPVATVPLTPTN